MLLEILTPSRTVYSNRIKLVKLPGTNGTFELLKNHAPIVSSLEKGTVKIIDNDNQTINVDIIGGVVECKSNQIVILTDSADIIKP